MLIVNKTNLPLKEIFKIICKVEEESDPGETFYYGKRDIFTIINYGNNKRYIIEIKYMKRYVKWVIKEVKK